MVHWQRTLLFMTLLGVTVTTLLATSPEPPEVELQIITSATPGDAFFYGYTDSAFVCQGEEAILLWRLNNGTQASLEASPSNHVEPELINQTIGQAGNKRFTVLDNVTLTISKKTTYQSQILLLAKELCDPINLTGTFLGDFNQQEPGAITLARQLIFSASENAYEAELRAINGNTSSIYLTCQHNTNTITCESKTFSDSPEVSFSLSGTMTENTFSGSYQGFDETASVRIPFSGSFSLTRQALAIPDSD